MMRSVDELASITVDCGFHIHKELGPGLLESVYEVVLAQALSAQGLSVVGQKPVAITFRGLVIPDAFRADLVVDDRLIVEIKSVEKASGSCEAIADLFATDQAAPWAADEFRMCHLPRGGEKSRQRTPASWRLCAFA